MGCSGSDDGGGRKGEAGGRLLNDIINILTFRQRV